MELEYFGRSVVMVVVVLVVVLVVVTATRVGRTIAIVVLVVLVVVAGGFDMAVTTLVWPLIGVTFPAVVPSKQDAVHAKIVRSVPTAIRENMVAPLQLTKVHNIRYAGVGLYSVLL
tara:strand:- start:2151 stop:2498 length:348 start_codon:yes stop_codon:yes gene_type:complete